MTDGDVRELDVLSEEGMGRRMVCPECPNILPLDNHVECSQCGAKIELAAIVHSGGQYE